MNIRSLVIFLLTIVSARCQLDQPVLGVVMLHTESEFPSGSTYALRNTLKWLEQYNIRWIPLYIDDEKSVLFQKLASVNGVFLTGGEEPLFVE